MHVSRPDRRDRLLLLSALVEILSYPLTIPSSTHLCSYLLKPLGCSLKNALLIVVPIMVKTVRHFRLDQTRWRHNDLNIRTPRFSAPAGVIAGIRVDNTDSDVAGRSNVVHLDRAIHSQRLPTVDTPLAHVRTAPTRDVCGYHVPSLQLDRLYYFNCGP